MHACMYILYYNIQQRFHEVFFFTSPSSLSSCLSKSHLKIKIKVSLRLSNLSSPEEYRIKSSKFVLECYSTVSPEWERNLVWLLSEIKNNPSYIPMLCIYRINVHIVVFMSIQATGNAFIIMSNVLSLYI